MASAVLKISRLGVYRTTVPKQIINQLAQRCLVEQVTYHISHDSASHPNEDHRDRHEEEHAVERSAPERVQDTLRRGGI